MKTLYLLRHAKSDWDGDASTDFERGLNDRGLKDAPAMGQHLLVMGILPQKIISSSARRALTTATLVAEQINYATDAISADAKIYNADLNTLLNVISELEDQYDSVMLVGHNPTFTHLANYLTGDNLPDMPTCSVYAIEFAVKSWQVVAKDMGTQLFFEYPGK